MKSEALLIFRLNDSDKSKGVSVRCFVKEYPEQLSPGDTFDLEIFENIGTAKVTSRHWQGRRLIIQCEVNTFVLGCLIIKSEQVPDSVDEYQLTEQHWE